MAKKTFSFASPKLGGDTIKQSIRTKKDVRDEETGGEVKLSPKPPKGYFRALPLSINDETLAMHKTKEGFEDKVYWIDHALIETYGDKIADFTEAYAIEPLVTKDGHLFIWAIKTPPRGDDDDDLGDRAYNNRMDILATSRKEWVKVKWNQSKQEYKKYPIEKEAKDDLPNWPVWFTDDDAGEKWGELLFKIIKDHHVANKDHAVAQKLLKGN